MVIDAIHKSWMRPEGSTSTLMGAEPGVRHANPDKLDEGVAEDNDGRERLTNSR